MKKVVIITNMPVPYRVPVFDFIDQHSSFDINVLYLTKLEFGREWVFDFERNFVKVLGSRSWRIGIKEVHFNFSLIQNLRQINPDIVIVSGYAPSYLLGMIYAIKHRKKIIMHTDASPKSEKHLSLFHHTLRKLLMPKIDAVLCTGNEAKIMHIARGFIPEQIFVSPLAINNEVFSSHSLEYSERDIDLLFVGRLEEIKNPRLFLQICETLAISGLNEIRAVIAGSGTLLESLRSEIQKLNLANLSISLVGHKNEEELAELFGRSKLFIFPSTIEPWGLVANEACASGTPLVASQEIGAEGDLLKNQVNSIIINGFKDKDWADAVAELLINTDTWQKLHNGCKESILPFTFQKSAAGIISSLEYVSKLGN